MWKFKKVEPGEPERDPHEPEFFRLRNPAEALVREVIQNSLDAKEAGQTVSIRFHIGEVEKRNARKYFSSELEQHLSACNFLPQDYVRSNRIKFIAIEDFGTSGLDGATGEDGSRPEKGNNFFDFWWREGMSGKRGREVGRWGLGKTTFHMASKLRLFFGLTLRKDDSRELLMGKALLKTHSMNDTRYQYYGYFKPGEDSKAFEDSDIIQDFKEKFSIDRENRSGLSLVIPMPDDEVTDLAIMRSVIIHYFYAIMKGILEVEIVTSSGIQERLTTSSIMNKAQTLDWHGTSWEDVNVSELLQFVSDSMRVTDTNKLVITEGMPDITENSFGNRVEKLKSMFSTGNILLFKVPVTIKKIINRSHSSTFFRIYLKREPQLKQAEEFYIRSGITIPEICEMKSRPVRGILIAEDTLVTEFLGDCENPAHTNWKEGTEGFKEKYENAKNTLWFIKKSMSKIVSILDQPPQERQRDLLKEIFFIPAERVEEEEEDKSKETKKPKIVIKERTLPMFTLEKIEGGFVVALNPKRVDITFPIRSRITVAYDVRKGNPFKRYESLDFDLSSISIIINSAGCTILNSQKNIMEIELIDYNFNLKVTGFDVHRDLIVSVKEEKIETQD
jgi:hypothetical protein